MSRAEFRTSSGSLDLGSRLRLAGSETHEARDPSVRLLAVLLVRQIKLTLSEPGHGRLYGAKRTPSGRLRKQHRASAPGEPPAVDSGTLRNSIAMDQESDARYRVGTNVAYAPPLEFGTLDEGGFIAPRPFMRPALRAVLSEWRTTIRTQLIRAIPRGGR